MKHFYFKPLLATLLLLCSLTTQAYGFEVDGIDYSITDKTAKTVEVATTYYGGYSGSVVIPENIIYNGTAYSVTSIAFGAFQNCRNLTSIEIPNSVTSIEDCAFQYCDGLTSIEIPNSVTNIGERAFCYCNGLTSIIVDSGNSVYDSRDNCNAIIHTSTNTLIAGCQNTIIPNSVASIGDNAFSSCDGLAGIEIPNSVTSIGNDAFSGCNGLTSIEIPNSVTSIGNYAFWCCDGLTSVTIGNSVTSIGNDAFWCCDGLTSIEIPNSVTSIGNGAFFSCNGLTSIIVDSGNSVYDSRDNCNAIIHTSTNTLIAGCKYTNIPNSVTSIGNNAFSGCYGLRSITIPNSVTSIGNGAFSSCDGLTSITIPNSVTSIGNGAFQYCDGLTSIEIPNSVTSIEDCAFQYCDGLTSVTIGNSVTSIGDKAFYGCQKLRTVINNSFLIFEKGSVAYGYVAYYATNLTNRISAPVVTAINRTQKTLTFSLSNAANNDVPSEMGIYFNGSKYPANKERVVTIGDLCPNTSYNVKSYAVYNGVTAYATSYTSCSTLPIGIAFTVESTATTLKFSGRYDVGDATFVSCGFVDYESEGENLILTGLEPATSYTVKFSVTTEEGGTAIETCTATTDALVFKTLPAKATSHNRAVICAEANIANEETGTGFEWRAMDAPDLVPSNSAPCAINNGVIEGALSNLSTRTYYKYRPYYCSAEGNYYYGEWIGFGTADAYVYFTPTVHTYAATLTALNAVKLNGYVLAGSDDIVEQGFEYWIKAASVTRSANNVMKITATGQRMSVLLEDLEYNKIYYCRAYVTTTKETVYGDVMTFETGGTTGIDDIEKDDDAPDNVFNGLPDTYYDLSGRIVEYPTKGIYLYNGKKIVIK